MSCQYKCLHEGIKEEKVTMCNKIYDKDFWSEDFVNTIMISITKGPA